MNKIKCPCYSHKDYSSCCGLFISGKENPTTPEELMRSRYTAYTMANIDYIRNTMRDDALIGFQEMDAKHWAKHVIWIKLHVFESTLENSNTGYVEFEAIFVNNARLQSIHEKSRFIRQDNRWYYVSGEHLPSTYPEQNISRNTTCPCGSQRKFKTCHGKSR